MSGIADQLDQRAEFFNNPDYIKAGFPGELVQPIAAELRHAATALREQSERIAELEAENERLQTYGIHSCHDHCQRTACVLRRRVGELERETALLHASLNRANEHHERLAERLEIRQDENAMPYDRIDLLEAENDRFRADLQGAEQRVLGEFAGWCDSQAMRCKYGQTAVEWAQRAEIVREYARQRAQAEGESDEQ